MSHRKASRFPGRAHLAGLHVGSQSLWGAWLRSSSPTQVMLRSSRSSRCEEQLQQMGLGHRRPFRQSCSQHRSRNKIHLRFAREIPCSGGTGLRPLRECTSKSITHSGHVDMAPQVRIQACRSTASVERPAGSSLTGFSERVCGCPGRSNDKVTGKGDGDRFEWR